MQRLRILLLALVSLAPLVRADDQPPVTQVKPKKVKYKSHKQVDFSKQVVEGKLRRPTASLVTAGEGVKDQSILRLRENFIDRFASDVSAEPPP